MSGDVQPRKRKDKKRRKEDEPVPIQAHAPIFTNNLVNDDVNIHVHKEHGTGGGICAKLVFFILLSALAVLIGLIITEHRGLTDLEAADSESKFSQLFDGWIDTSSNSHDDHDDHDLKNDLDDHEDDHDQEEVDVSEAEDEEHQPSEEDEEHEHSEEDEEHGNSEEDEEQQLSEEDEEHEHSDEEVEEDAEEGQNESVEDEHEDNEEEDNESEVDEEKYSEEENEEIRESDEEATSKEVDESREESDENKEEQAFDEEDPDDDDSDADGDAKENEVDDDETVDEGNEDEEKTVESKERLDDVPAEDGDESDSKVGEEKTTAKKLGKRDISAESDQVVKPEETSNSINMPQDQVEDSDSDRQSDDVEYEHMNISNKDDFEIRREIDEAQKSVENNPNYAIRLFDNILQKFPSSPRSLYGKALALDRLADQKRSNSVLEQALKLYLQLLKTKNVPDPLFELAAERCLNRMRFIGQYSNAILVHKLIVDRFPGVPKHMNDMVITYLTINRIDDARSVLKRILAKSPDDGVALVHYGFILKTADNNLESAVTYLKRGIRTGDKGVIDGRFFFHLGDALARLSRTEEAMKVYEEGTEHKVFLSKYQRSLYNVPRLTGKPWWQPADLPYPNSFKLLKQNWKKIREEALSVLNVQGYFQDESENLKDTGDWKQFELYARGRKNERNCRKCPFTCSIIDQIPEARSCTRGQTKFSVMHPGTHVWPHCGPTNCRLRTHLGLKVPPGTYIRVASETRSWKEGEIIVFDDSFEHEVWHNGTQLRLVLIVDIWHPELTPSEKRNLSPI